MDDQQAMVVIDILIGLAVVLVVGLIAVLVAGYIFLRQDDFEI